MKFALLTSALLAALAAAQPLTNEEQFAVDYTSGTVTGEVAPELSGAVEARSLQKRSVQFIVYPSADCSGGGTVITQSPSGSKGDFNPAQHSVKILQLTNGWHLTLYTGLKQSGVLTRFFATEVGSDKCYTGSWLSYGLFSS